MPKSIKPKLIILYVGIINIVLLGIFFLLRSSIVYEINSPIGATVQVLSSLFHDKPTKTVYGYLPYWMLENAKYLQYDKLTDIAYFGLKLDQYGEFDASDPGYQAWLTDKRVEDVIKKANIWGVRFAITIVNQEDDSIDYFLNCTTCWETAYTNIAKELTKRRLKDVNVDFEHTTETTADIPQKYTAFIQFLNTRLDAEFGDSKVIVATFADSFVRQRVSNPVALAQAADGLFIMAYDYHQPTSEYAGPVAPLYANQPDSEYDVSKTLDKYLSEIAPQKLILGVPYYGYNFLTENSEARSARVPGTDYAGFTVSQYYAMIRDSDKIPFGSQEFDENSNTPYIIYRNSENQTTRVLHFENEKSLEKKYDFALIKNLQGIGIWALGYDGDYPELWNLISRKFKD